MPGTGNGVRLGLYFFFFFFGGGGEFWGFRGVRLEGLVLEGFRVLGG